MSNYSAEDVKKLREKTGSGMMDCKKALDETNGDFNAAIELLRVKGAKDVGKREGRNASAGIVSGIVSNKTDGAFVEVNCETDFVAKTDDFIKLGDKVASLILSEKPKDVEALMNVQSDGKSVQQLLDEANASMTNQILLFQQVLVRWFNLIKKMIKLQKMLLNKSQLWLRFIFHAKVFQLK